MRYLVYGLLLESELPLPELTPAVESGAGPDVRLRLVAPEYTDLPDGMKIDRWTQARSGALRLEVPKVGIFLVTDGRDIALAPNPQADHSSLRLFLLGSAFGALLMQRGLLVLHGNAIRIGDRCMACLGHSGAGKSTLAAGFMQRGHSVFADDVVPVTGDGRAIPGLLRIKLWQDAADRLGIDTRTLSRVEPAVEKFTLPLTGTPDSGALPLRWVYLLHPVDDDGITLTELHGMARFSPLHTNSYRPHFLERLDLRQQHMAMCAALAPQIRVVEVRRPRHGFKLDALIDCLLADMAAHP